MQVLFVRDFHYALINPVNSTSKEQCVCGTTHRITCFLRHMFKNEESMFWLLNLSTKWWMCLSRSSSETIYQSCFTHLPIRKDNTLICASSLGAQQKVKQKQQENLRSDDQNQLTKSTFYKETSAASSTRCQVQNNPNAFIQRTDLPKLPSWKNVI